MRAEETVPNQSRPIFLTDGSDFFIATQIYQTAAWQGRSALQFTVFLRLCKLRA